MPENTEIRWIHPETRKKAALKARYAASASRWNLNTALSLFGLIILVLVMGMVKVNLILTVAVAIFGLSTVWLLARRKSKKLFGRYYEWEIARHPDEWKDYYRVLGIGPNADSEKINKAFERLSGIYSEVLSDKARTMPLYSMMFREAKEAYEALKNPVIKADYDRVFWQRYNGEKTDIEVPARSAIVDLSHSITREVSEYLERFGWRLPGFSRTQKRVCLAVVAALLALGVSGTSLAFARPDSALAAPFRGAAMTIAQITSGAINLIDEVRSIGASSERQIVSTSLQLMRITEDVRHMNPVAEPTNDMSCFPSAEHSLYPSYLDRRYSQFSYTVDSYGIITVYTDTATTGPVLEKIKSILVNLE